MKEVNLEEERYKTNEVKEDLASLEVDQRVQIGAYDFSPFRILDIESYKGDVSITLENNLDGCIYLKWSQHESKYSTPIDLVYFDEVSYKTVELKEIKYPTYDTITKWTI